MRNIVFFSGGIGSAASVLRLLDQGASNITLLFADTLIEDPDLYRFIHEFADKVSLPLVRVADGRTPHQLFQDIRFLGNSRLAQCSHRLKQKPCREWVEAHCTPDDTNLIVGIDWSEIHRLEKIKKGWHPYQVKAPLCSAPYLDKIQCASLIKDLGVDLPALYSKGFPHNNCGGGCVRAGQGQWRKLLKVFPERFHTWEVLEGEMELLLGKKVTILPNMSLTELREKVEAEDRLGIQLDLFDLGGCGCFSDMNQEEL